MNLGSLAADVLFEIMDHLSVVDVLRSRQAGNDLFPEKGLLISLVHPLHRSVHIFNGSHGTRLSGIKRLLRRLGLPPFVSHFGSPRCSI